MPFAYTGAPVTFTPPGCATSITVDMNGAAGGTTFCNDASFCASTPGSGGMGARIQGSLAITGGSTIVVDVGGVGGNALNGTAGAGGFNGGGDGGNSPAEAGGGGGGASDIRIGGSDMTDRVFVAAGGGGAGMCSYVGFVGGYGGSATGGGVTACSNQSPATGGTQTAGGVGSIFPGYDNGHSGQLGEGGQAGADGGGGGGGGGYYGGGGGAWTGGAGASSFAAADATNVVETANYSATAGSVTISW
jgi:hypothetical protein